MYLNDLLEALNKGESIDLSTPKLKSIFQKQRFMFAYQHVALFYKLELRDWRETKIQVANRIGVSGDDIKQHDGAMNLLTDEMAERVLNALCAGELWEGTKKIGTSTLYKKLRDGYRPKSITRKGNQWYIQFS